jgi:predicted RNA-binding Zn-ribbon protein involved in translation (DUF1610 family)
LYPDLTNRPDQKFNDLNPGDSANSDTTKKSLLFAQNVIDLYGITFLNLVPTSETKMNCPKCNSTVESRAYFHWLGLLGRFAFPKYLCPKCGKVELGEFPEDARKKLKTQRLIARIVFLGIFILVVVYSTSR